MTRIEIQDYIKLALSPIDKTSRFHSEYIKMACDLVYAQKMSQINDDLVGDLDLFSKEYTSQTVTLDATKNLYYTTLPVEIISIPGISSGVRKINTNQGLDQDFVCITEQMMYYMDGSVTQDVDTAIWYWLQGQKIWYNESMTSAIATAGVRIILLPRFHEFATSDPIHIPGASDLDFIGQVIQLLAPTAPVDLKANNA